MDDITICRMEKEMKMALLARFGEFNELLDRLLSAVQEYKYFCSGPFYRELREAVENLQDFFEEFGQNVAITITRDGEVAFKLVNDGTDTIKRSSLFTDEYFISFLAKHKIGLS